MQEPSYQIIHGNTLDVLKKLPDNSIQVVCTSPPYYNLRNYGLPTTKWGDGWEGCLGLEPTPEMYISHMVEICQEVKRVLRKDGTFWLNIGDSYATSRGGRDKYTFENSHKQSTNKGSLDIGSSKTWKHPSIKRKDLLGIPWFLAFELRKDGWWLRSDIIWCLSGSTYVYVKSQKGEMPMMIKDLHRLNPSTIKLWNGKKWTQMIDIVKSGKRKEQIELVLRSGERIRCTKNHYWPVRGRGNVEASRIQIGDIIESCNLPEPENPKSPEFIPDEIGWLLGLYLAEGSCDSNGNIQLSGNISEEEYRLNKIEKIVEKYGGSCCCFNTHGNTITINIYSKIILSIIKNYIHGNNAKNKHLRVSCWQRSNKFLQHLLDGYLDGDGHRDEENNRYRLGFTRNYDLERDLRTLCSRLKYQLTLNLSTSNIGDRTFPSFRGEIRFTTSNHHNCKDRQEVIEINDAKMANYYDIEVEDDPHLFALTSGTLTHNSKTNAMPGSAKDRPVTSHEYIFQFSKSQFYYYDYISIMEPAAWDRWGKQTVKKEQKGTVSWIGEKSKEELEEKTTRNKRTVWSVPTANFSEAHFAVMPEKIVEPCIFAGTSEMGCCPECGNPLVRIGERKRIKTRKSSKIKKDNTKMANRDPERHITQYETLGWEKSCNHIFEDTVPCKVLDIFNGAGTVGCVALKHNRDYIGIELNSEYVDMTKRRLEKIDPMYILEKDIFDIAERESK